MPEELDPAVAQQMADGALCFLALTPSQHILCTKPQLLECLSILAQEAYEKGFLAAQKEQFEALGSGGSADRGAWMEIRLDDADELARYGIRLRPVVVGSLREAGYRALGDLRWASAYDLRKLFYIGRITARQIRTAIRQLQAVEPEPSGISENARTAAC